MKRASRPLQVLVLNERCHANPLAGGAELHLFEVFGRLAAQGVSVDLLCCGFEGADASSSHAGIRIHRVGSRLSYYTHIVREVRRRVRRGEVDVIVEDLNKIPFYSPLYAGVPVVAMHHHLHGLTAFEQVNPLIASASVMLEAGLGLAYRGVPFLTVSSSSKADLIRRGVPEENIDVVPNGVDQLHRPARLTGRAPEIVSLGRLEPYKRLDLLLRSLKRVAADVPEVHLNIIGRGQDEPRLRRLTRTLGLEPHVTFHGFVDEGAKVAMLQRAALLVQCSKKEGWGLTVTEAYACGTPVVATDVPGLRDSVQDGVTGLLVRKPKAHILASAITGLLRDEAWRVCLARRALHWCEGLSWDDGAEHVEGVLRRAVRRPRPTPIRERLLPDVLRRQSELAARPATAHDVSRGA